MVLKYLFFSLRPKQWIKNLFILLPLVFGKRLLEWPITARCILLFFVFSIISGSVYLINDILDIENDKRRRLKRLRPIASGKVSIRAAWITALILATGGLWAAFTFGASVGITAVFYLALNFLYSKFLKNLVIIDVFCIGIFFVLRVIAGTFAAEVEFSHWMIFMVALLAMFLGFNKRRQELKTSPKEKADQQRFALRKYNSYFIDQMISALMSSIVVVYMIYTVDSRTVHNFGTHHLIYSIPFVYYGIFRYLYLIHKRKKGGDPTLLLIGDGMMQINLLLWILTCILVIYFRF